MFSERPSDFYKDAFWVVSYVANWAHIYGAFHTEYLGHTWSLAVEEQFYILWPTLLILGLKLVSSKVTLFRIVLIASITSAILRYIMQIDGAYLYRIYCGLDTRADSILMGCAIAILLPIMQVYITEKFIYILQHVSLAAFGGLFIISLTCYFDNANMIKYGYFAVTILASTVVFSLPLLSGKGLIGHVLLNPVLRYTGKISYGLYLCHVPIFGLLKQHTKLGSIGFIVVGMSASFLISILSFEFIEKRFLTKKSVVRMVSVGGQQLEV